MRSRLGEVVSPLQVRGFAEEIQRLLTELGSSVGPEPSTEECSPALDVYETEATIELVMDLPGVALASVRVVAVGDHVLIAGIKGPRRERASGRFHLVERDVGQFARAVRLEASCDTRRARATLRQGELRVSLPKIVDRRGSVIAIPVTAGLPTT